MDYTYSNTENQEIMNATRRKHMHFLYKSRFHNFFQAIKSICGWLFNSLCMRAMQVKYFTNLLSN